MRTNRFRRATGKCVGSSSVHPIYIYIPTKCLSWLRIDYMPMQMTQHYCMAVVRKTAGTPVVTASLNRDLARIQEWCNHWHILPNPNKTETLVVSRSRTANPPHFDFILSWVYIHAGPNLGILCVKFDSKLTFEDPVRGIVSRVSRRISILRLVICILVVKTYITSLLFCFCSPNP